MQVAWLPVRLARSGCIARPTMSNSLSRTQSVLSASRTLTTASQADPITAAPPINFTKTSVDSKDGRVNRFKASSDFSGSSDDSAEPRNLDEFYARLVPVSPSYFTGSPTFVDNMLFLQALLRKYEALPTVKPSEAPRMPWRTMLEYRNIVGEPIKRAKYQKVVQILQRLNQIHPSLAPRQVTRALQSFKRDIDPLENVAKPIKIDNSGRALGVGRRKASVARAWVVEGTGEILINGKTMTEMFARVHDRESAMWALKCTERIDKYNVWAMVEGGGTTGQAEALTLAVAKALLAHEPALKPALRRAGCVTRDPRRVERKKPGHVKARKMPAWVRR